MTYHYGIFVDPDIPITGVFSNNSIDIWDAANNGIDPEYDEYESSCTKDAEEFTDEEEKSEALANALDGYCQTHSYIGFKYEEVDGVKTIVTDPEAEYSAIVELDGSFYCTQVVRSKWVIRCNLCSPCFPGQGDANTPGKYLAYSVPPEILSYGQEELKARIFKKEESQ